MNLQKCVSAKQIKMAKVGSVFFLSGHRASATSTVFKAGLKFTTHMGFVVFKPSMPVYKVTVIEIVGFP